jgi:alpha-beta hydrolase superfamily lysophospholipase
MGRRRTRIGAVVTLVGLLAATTTGLTPSAAVAAADRVHGGPFAGVLLSYRPMPVSSPIDVAGGHGYRLRYVSTSDQGLPRIVSGTLIVPRGRPPAGGWPVASWAHGGTGSADACAPSRTADLGGFDHLIAGLVSAGYAVAATDYEGLGTIGPHPFLIAGTEARGVIDVVKAARQTGLQLADRWVAIGHSQGAQAVAKAGEIDHAYGRGLTLTGTAALSAPINLATSVGERLRTIADNYGAQALYVLILAGLKTKHPELRYADYLGHRARQQLAKVETTCLNDLAGVFAGLDLPAAEFRPADDRALRRLENWLAEEAIPQSQADRPLAVFYGDADEIVTPAEARQTVAAACALGTTAFLRTYPGVDHNGILTAALPDAVRWMDRRMAGSPAPSSC